MGLSIGVTRLFYVLSEQGLLNGGVVTAPCDAIVLPMTADTAFAAHVATVLRDAGVRTQLYTEDKKFKQKLSYAGKLAVPYAVIIGEDELECGEVSLKDMSSEDPGALHTGGRRTGGPRGNQAPRRREADKS